MQGRLSTQTDHGYQAFPWETWEDEFLLAAKRRIEHIEWVVDSRQVQNNPILIRPQAVGSIVQESGVRVRSVCADYLMDSPLEATARQSWDVFARLVQSMQELEAQWLVIPCVDQASLRDRESRARLLDVASSIEALVLGTQIQISLETDLGPDEFAELLAELDERYFGVNYDTGNSASLGYNPDEEFAAYGERVRLVHIKDRVRDGGSVFLGQGNANIPCVIGHLEATGFSGPVTMQAFRNIEGVSVLDQQLVWLDELMRNGK